jgi:hypothetical protein
MSQQLRAEPPTVLSTQVQSAIDSYQQSQAGPTLADHVAKELLKWLAHEPCSRGGSGGGTPFLHGGGEGVATRSHEPGEGGPSPLSFSPLNDKALKADAKATKSAAPFSFGEMPADTESKVFEWNDTLNIVAGGGQVFAQLIAMRLTIWDTGDWTLFIGFRTFARVRIKIDISLTDGGLRGLCSVSSGWQYLNSTSGHIDCLVFGGHDPCVGQFFSIIKNAWRSTVGIGPL